MGGEGGWEAREGREVREGGWEAREGGWEAVFFKCSTFDDVTNDVILPLG